MDISTSIAAPLQLKTEVLDNNTMSRQYDNINHVEEVLINISLCVETTLSMAFFY